jgi:hypothetical protein
VYEIIAQTIGLLGAGFLMLSFQMKSSRKFFAYQSIGSGLFLINYLMLGAYTGVLISIVSVTRSVLISALNGKKKYPIVIALMVATVISGFFIYTGIETVLMITAYVVFTASMLTKSSRLIRITQFTVASPLQLAHNIIVFSLGGILCESFNMISIIVSIFRLGLKGFDDKGETKDE